MGPHSNECGNEVRPDEGRLRVRASMGPHSNECGNSLNRSLARNAGRRFNGAALQRVRKFAVLLKTAKEKEALQWGRTPTSAEITAAPHTSESVAGRFNGAALQRVRKSQADAQSRHAAALLQWGRTPTSAEIASCFVTRPRRSLLQWGRTPTSAEMRRRPVGLRRTR